MRLYEILLDKRVQKFLSKADEHIIRLFRSKIEIMQHNPLSEQLDIKKYSEWWPNNYRLRIGKYRFLFEIIDHKVLIYFYDADSRWDIYK